MSDSDDRVNGWIIVAFAWSVLYTFFGLLILLLADRASPAVCGFFFLIAVLSAVSAILALGEHYSAAKVLMWIAGILSLPFGVIMIRAGNRIKQATHAQPRRRGLERSQ